MLSMFSRIGKINVWVIKKIWNRAKFDWVHYTVLSTSVCLKIFMIKAKEDKNTSDNPRYIKGKNISCHLPLCFYKILSSLCR